MDLQLQPSKAQSFLLKGNVALTTASLIQSMSAATLSKNCNSECNLPDI